MDKYQYRITPYVFAKRKYGVKEISIEYGIPIGLEGISIQKTFCKESLLV